MRECDCRDVRRGRGCEEHSRADRLEVAPACGRIHEVDDSLMMCTRVHVAKRVGGGFFLPTHEQPCIGDAVACTRSHAFHLVPMTCFARGCARKLTNATTEVRARTIQGQFWRREQRPTFAVTLLGSEGSGSTQMCSDSQAHVARLGSGFIKT